MELDAGAELRAPRASRARRFRNVTLPQLAFGVGLLVLWQVAASTGLISKSLFSDPVDIVRRIVSMAEGELFGGAPIWEHLWVTLQEMGVGYLIGAVSGAAVGFGMGRARTLSRVFEPYLLAFNSIPKIAVAPLFILIMGIGVESKVAIVAMSVFFMVFFSTFAGVLAIREEYVQLARIMGASYLHVLTHILFPAALPSIMVGLKVGIPFAMIGAMVGEFIAATRGLGWLIINTTSKFDASGLFAGIAYLVALVWILGQILAFVESRLLRWQSAQQHQDQVTVA